MAGENLEEFGYKKIAETQAATTWSLDEPHCPRCSFVMDWRHGSWQCPTCKYKEGCCEGEPQSE